jgi:hypothetical protein
MKETLYPLYRRLGGPRGRSGQALKISSPLEFEPQTVQPVESRYTDYAIPATYVAYFQFYYIPECVVDRVLWSEIKAMPDKRVW